MRAITEGFALCKAPAAARQPQHAGFWRIGVTLAIALGCAASAFAQSSGSKPGAQPRAVIETSMGTINCTLFPNKAPQGVTNFIGLATGSKPWVDPRNSAKREGVPLYDGVIFHRVIPNFMIQGGDPTGTGMGDPGYRFQNETSPDLTFDRPGRLAYANAGPNTNGSQFFITEVPYPSLNGNYTIFGQCDNAEVVQKIARVPRDARDKPVTPVVIKHIKIVQPGAAKPAAAKR